MQRKLINKNSKRLEIERKFLVKSSDWLIGHKGVVYKQGYLSTEASRTVRIRLEGEKGKLTIKGKKKGIAGIEFEYSIPKGDAEYLLKNICRKPIIEKIRYKIKFGGFIWEVDIFDGENKGLKLAEIELQSINQEFRTPDWVGEEVTHDRRFRNANLVSNPFSNWKHKLKNKSQ
jgi:CYTH domain-containing protein